MIELYQGDCLELMKNIPDNSVDLLLTAPPYGIDFQSRYHNDKTKRMSKILNDKKPFTDFIPLIKSKIAKQEVYCVSPVGMFSRFSLMSLFVTV